MEFSEVPENHHSLPQRRNETAETDDFQVPDEPNERCKHSNDEVGCCAMSDDWPKMYRSMLPAEPSASPLVPAVGTDQNMLGVIVSVDVHPDVNGWVAPNDEGLSVGPSLKALPPARVPERLRDKRPGARGADNLRVFRAGTSSFQQAPLGDHLELKPTSKRHAVVQPRHRALVDDYQRDLADTQRYWAVDEE